LNQKGIKILVLDEVHYIKNYKAKRTQAVQQVKSEKIIALSGTPLLNRPIELWTTLHLVAPKIFKDFWYFAKRYCNAHQTRYGWDMNGASNLEELAMKLRTTIMLRREKKDVLMELPDKIRTVIPLKLQLSVEIIKIENEIKNILKQLEEMTARINELKQKIKAGEVEEKELKDEIEKIRLRRMESQKVAFERIEKYRQEIAKAKLPFIVEFIRDIITQNGDSLVVFCHHQEIYDALLKEFGDIAVGIVGGMDARERQEAVEKFQNDKNIKIFVGSIHAAGEGITLTRASKVVFAEYDWTPAKMIQAEDRVHRIGQKEIVNSYWFSVINSIDEMFIGKLIQKMNIINTTLETKDEDVILFLSNI